MQRRLYRQLGSRAKSSGNGEGEGRAFAELAFRPDPPAMHLYEAAAERQPQAGTLIAAGVGPVDLLELSEQLGQILRLHPASGVPDRDRVLRRGVLHRERGL